MPRSAHRLRLVLLAALLAVGALLLPATRTHAAADQISMLEDDALMSSDPTGTLAQLRLLGVQNIREQLHWELVAPAPGSYHRPHGFNASDPGASAYNWSAYDALIIAADKAGVGVDLDLMGGGPLWAMGKGAKGHTVWEPSAREYGEFVQAAGARYSGDYTPPGASAPLPRVHFWSIWNEPDYGPSLAPQGVPGHLRIDYAPRMYRSLVDAAWSAFQRTGHGGDTILFGEVAPRGYDYWGVFSGMKPLVFLRSLYCVDSRYRPLRGSAARIRGCPTDSAGSQRFAAEHPGLFQATGFADHPYMRWYPPNKEQNPDPVTHRGITDYSTLGTIGTLERGLDRLLRVYGSHRRLPIYDTEFGYITSPPKRRWSGDRYPWVSQPTAAYYLNWAEYIHWRDPRLVSFEQYLLRDPLPTLRSNDYGSFASGLLTYSGRQKPTYSAWRLPLYLPVTSARRGSRLEVWGCVRPAHYALAEGLGAQTAHIQVAPGSKPSNGQFQDVATVQISDPRNCYFDQKIAFPGSGVETVRMTWQYPTSDPLGYFDQAHAGATAYSRHVLINLR